MFSQLNWITAHLIDQSLRTYQPRDVTSTHSISTRNHVLFVCFTDPRDLNWQEQSFYQKAKGESRVKNWFAIPNTYMKNYRNLHAVVKAFIP